MTDLIDLDCYKQYKGIKNTERDGKLQTLITQASAFVENYCNRKFTAYSTNPKTEWFSARTNIVYLTEFPVISVDTVNVSGDGGLTQTLLVENDPNKAGYYVDLDAGTVRTQNDYYEFWSGLVSSLETEYRSLEIEYKAGYTIDTLPEDLKLAVQDLVHYYEESENKPTQTLLGATIDNPLPYTGASLPAHIRRVLDLYRYSPN